MKHIEVEGGRFFVGRLHYGSDAMTEIKKFVVDKKILSGFFVLIGAVKSAVIGFYDQDQKRYIKRVYDDPMEVVSCVGNVSECDGDLIVHAHVCFAFEDGTTAGGHLFSMSVFAGEFFMQEFKGGVKRQYDDITGLNLFDF